MIHDKRVVILLYDDWQALYVDGKIVTQGHNLGEGDGLYLLRMAQKHNFTIDDVHETYVNEGGDAYLEDVGCFPDALFDWSVEFNEK